MPRDPLYADDALEGLVGFVVLARGDSNVDAFLLERHVGDLFRAAGLPVDDSEEAEVWRELLENQPSHADFAKLFRRMARAKDPFADKADYDLALPELNAKARVRWARRIHRRELGRLHALFGVRWTDLSESERADVREMARELAYYHQSFVRRGMPFKNDQNTLMNDLATIFASFTHFALHHCELPHAEESRFIRFASVALRPFFPATEVSVSALSRRWKRLKEAHRNSQPSD